MCPRGGPDGSAVKTLPSADTRSQNPSGWRSHKRFIRKSCTQSTGRSTGSSSLLMNDQQETAIFGNPDPSATEKRNPYFPRSDTKYPNAGWTPQEATRSDADSGRITKM